MSWHKNLVVGFVLLLVSTGCSNNNGGGGGDITGAENGDVPGLVVVDGDFEQWFVATAELPEGSSPTSQTVQVAGYTARCDKQGAVGYAVEESRSTVRITLVLGESGDVCQDVGLLTSLDVPLETPLGTRRVVLVKPTRTPS